jgi:hypothetical protein
MIASMENGLSVEVGMVGKEGMFNVSSILGDERPSHGAMVQLPGSALLTTTAVLRREAQAYPPLLGLLLRYSQTIPDDRRANRSLQSSAFVGATLRALAALGA